MLHPDGKAVGWPHHPFYVQKWNSLLCLRVLASLDAGVVQGRTSGYAGNAGSAVTQQNYKPLTRLVGERRKEVEKEKVYYGVISTESSEEKMVKLWQFSETQIKTLI